MNEKRRGPMMPGSASAGFAPGRGHRAAGLLTTDNERVTMDVETERNESPEPVNIVVRSGGQFFVESQNVGNAVSGVNDAKPEAGDSPDDERGAEKC